MTQTSQLSADKAQTVSFFFASEPLEVRAVLRQLRNTLAAWHLYEDDMGSVELVLGEVLNNIVEHAYHSEGQGQILLSCIRESQVLRFTVRDEGMVLPRQRVPEGKLPAMGRALETLPESGFGWYLVKNLACDLSYARKGKANELSFAIAYASECSHAAVKKS